MYKQHFYLTCYPTLLRLTLILLYIMQGYLLLELEYQYHSSTHGHDHDLCKAHCMRSRKDNHQNS